MALIAQTVAEGSVLLPSGVSVIVVELFVITKFHINSRKVFFFCCCQFCSKKHTVGPHDSLLPSAISKAQVIGVRCELHEGTME